MRISGDRERYSHVAPKQFSEKYSASSPWLNVGMRIVGAGFSVRISAGPNQIQLDKLIDHGQQTNVGATNGLSCRESHAVIQAAERLKDAKCDVQRPGNITSQPRRSNGFLRGFVLSDGRPRAFEVNTSKSRKKEKSILDVH
jgi:hypothetical protein